MLHSLDQLIMLLGLESVMANAFQKLLFSLSSLSPVVLVFSVVYYENDGSLCIFFALLLSSLLMFVVGGVIFIKLLKRNTQVCDFRNQISSMETDTQGISSLIGAYAIPLISLFADKSSFGLFAITVISLSLLLFLSCSIPPTVFLLLAGYRFYIVSLNSGLSGVHLISRRRNLRSASEIENARWLFKNDYWLLDCKE